MQRIGVCRHIPWEIEVPMGAPKQPENENENEGVQRGRRPCGERRFGSWCELRPRPVQMAQSV